jgi:3-deoxy-7-phosphoheptulonate synthase
MKAHAGPAEIARVCARVESLGYKPHIIPGEQRTAIGITGNSGPVDPAEFEDLPGVAEAIRVSKAYKLVSRETKPENTVVPVNGVPVGGEQIVLCGGPCAVESREQILESARAVKAAGGQLLRGGAYKPRTSPYSFQGLGEEGLRHLADARAETGLGIVTEAIDVETFDLVERYADCVQIGARNMQNFSLLRRAGRSRKPILLKRGMSSTLEEFSMAAEYILADGNYNVILCERGIRSSKFIRPPNRPCRTAINRSIRRNLSSSPMPAVPSRSCCPKGDAAPASSFDKRRETRLFCPNSLQDSSIRIENPDLNFH